MDLDTLGKFSRDFAAVLLSVYPEWRPFAKSDGRALGYLVVNVPSPPGSDLSSGLFISTDNDEVTVGFDSYHAHYDWPARDIHITLDPMKFIAAILNEKVAAASVWAGEKWCGSWLVAPGENPEQHKFISPGKRVRVRSWKGTLDQDFDV